MNYVLLLILAPVAAVCGFMVPLSILVLLALAGLASFIWRKWGWMLLLMVFASNVLGQGFGSFTDQPFMVASGGVCGLPNFIVSSGTLIMEVVPSCTQCITNTTDLSDVTNVFDLTTNHNDLIGFANGDHGVVGFSRPPTFSQTNGPAGNPVVWFKNPLAGNAPAVLFTLNTNLLPAQPSTIFMALSVSNIAGASGPGPGTWSDSYYYVSGSPTGGRELAQFAGSSGSAGVWFAGSSVALPAWTNPSWVVHTIVFDGASSVWRTNGVLFKAGNPGTGGITRLEIGSDQTGSTQGIGLLGAYLIYTGHMATNDMIAVENNIRSVVGF